MHKYSQKNKHIQENQTMTLFPVHQQKKNKFSKKHITKKTSSEKYQNSNIFNLR